MTNLLVLPTITIGSDATFLKLLDVAQNGSLQLSDDSGLRTISGKDDDDFYEMIGSARVNDVVDIFLWKQDLEETFSVLHDLLANWRIYHDGMLIDFGNAHEGQLVITISPNASITIDPYDRNVIRLDNVDISVTLPPIKCSKLTEQLIARIESLKDPSIVLLNLKNGDVRIG